MTAITILQQQIKTLKNNKLNKCKTNFDMEIGSTENEIPRTSKLVDDTELSGKIAEDEIKMV